MELGRVLESEHQHLDYDKAPISVIIPYFNDKAFINNVVQGVCSAFKKAGAEGEILIVDDSSNESPLILESGMPIRIITLPKRSGVSRARNKGAEEAKYDWLLFIDSDVVIDENSILKLRQTLNSDGDIDAVTGVYDATTSGKEFFGKFLATYATFTWTGIEPKKDVHESGLLWSQFMLIKKDCFFSAGLFDVSGFKPCLEDVELSMRVGILNKKMVLDKRIQNMHLKSYSLKKLMKNYYEKAASWAKIKSSYRGFKYKGYESSDKRNSLIFSASTPPVIAASLIFPLSLMLLIISASGFYFSNRKFLKFSSKIHGRKFMLKSIPTIYAMNLVVLNGVIAGFVKNYYNSIMLNSQRYLRLLKNYLFKPLGSLESMTVFVTNKCNFGCYYCCFAEHLNKKEDILTLDELTQVSKKVGHLENVIFTGGEPFIRQDFVQVVKAFYDNASIRKISIITNGSLASKVKRDVIEMLQLCPELHIILNFSYEGTKELQQEVRGANSFNTLQKTMGMLNEVAKIYPRLRVEYIYTFHGKNQHGLHESIKENVKTNDNMITINLQRGYPGNIFVDGLDADEYNKVSKLVYSHNSKKGYNFFLGGVVRKAKRLSQYMNYLTYKDRAWKLPCYAGRLNVTLYNTGYLHPCELLRENYGNVREFNFDVRKMLRTAKAKSITKPIIKDKCFCTHECNQITNVLFNPRFLPKLVLPEKLSKAQF